MLLLLITHETHCHLQGTKKSFSIDEHHRHIMYTQAQTQICLFPEPPRPLPTRRDGSHLQCQKSHPRDPTTTLLWPETARWKAQRNSGRRPGSALWPLREPHLYGKTQLQRVLTALRSTYLRLRQGYEDTTRDAHGIDM